MNEAVAIPDTQIRLSGKTETHKQDSVLLGYCNFGDEYGYAYIRSMPNRGIATVDITYGSDNEIDFSFLEKQLCSECIGKILEESQAAWAGKYRNVFLVDFQTMEFYSLPVNIIAFMRNNYYIHVDHADGQDRILIVYAPEQQ